MTLGQVVRRLAFGLSLCALALAPIAGAAPATTYGPGGPIAFVDGMPAAPYPSTITVSGAPIFVTDVNVILTGITHDFGDDIDMLLVGPTGKTVVLISDAGNGDPVTAADITLDDAAGAPLPDESALTTGTYKPSNYFSATAGCPNEDPDPFPAPAPVPAPVYGSLLSGFNGTNPNGDWDLYVLDDCTLFAPTGSIATWSLEITATPTAVRVSQLRATARGGSVAVRWRTAAETSVLGFNVYRAAGAGATKLNRALIRAKPSGRTGGASYVLVDRRVRAHASYTYRLQTVEMNGRRSWSGSVSITAGR